MIIKQESIDAILKTKDDKERIALMMKNFFSFQAPSLLVQNAGGVYSLKKNDSSRNRIKKLAVLPRSNSRNAITDFDSPIKPKRMTVQYKYQRQKQQLTNILKQDLQKPQIKQQTFQHKKHERGSKSENCSYSKKKLQLIKKMQSVKAQSQKIRSLNLPGLANSVKYKKTISLEQSLTLLTDRDYEQNSFLNQIKNKTKASIVMKNFMKGYMSYDSQAKRFWQQHKNNLQKSSRFSTNFLGVSANYFFVLDAENLTVIASRKSQVQIEIASLTKIMTAYLCILACKKYEVDINTYNIRVSEKASQMPGTSAELQTGDVLTIKQLLYGLMLPSGNDASVAIAEGVGRIIQRNKKKPSAKTPYQTFISHMNILAKQLQLESSFQNSSGLSTNPNFSTAQAISILTAISIKNSVFREIINTKQYQLDIKNQRFGLTRQWIWKNTNKLLWKNWKGVKTGTTDTAGHCLMAWKDSLIYCVCDCETLSKRFSDCIKLDDELKKRMQNELITSNKKKEMFPDI